MASIDPRTGKISKTPLRKKVKPKTPPAGPDMPRPSVYKKRRPAGEVTPKAPSRRRSTPTRGSAAAASRRLAIAKGNTGARGRTSTKRGATTPKSNPRTLRALRSGKLGGGPRPRPRGMRSVATRRRQR